WTSPAGRRRTSRRWPRSWNRSCSADKPRPQPVTPAQARAGAGAAGISTRFREEHRRGRREAALSFWRYYTKHTHCGGVGVTVELNSGASHLECACFEAVQRQLRGIYELRGRRKRARVRENAWRPFVKDYVDNEAVFAIEIDFSPS